MKRKRNNGKEILPEVRLKAFLLFFLLSLGMITACTAPEEPLGKSHRPVRVMEATLEEQQQKIRMTGEVLPSETRFISFMVSGRIDGRFVDKEDEIGRETLLAKVNDLDYQRALQGARSNLQAAQANLDKAVAGAAEEEILELELQLKKAREASLYADQQLGRMQGLFQAGGISQAELDRTVLETSAAEASYRQVEAQYQRMVDGARPEDISALAGIRDAAQAEVSHYETQVERTWLYAPHAGTVAELFYQEGEMYQQGTPFLALNSPHQMVRVSVSQQQRSHIKTGDRVMVKHQQGNAQGAVIMVSSSPDPLTRTYRVELEVPEVLLTLGELVEVEFTTTGVVGTPLPMKAVLAGNPDYVYVIDNQTAKRVPINLQRVDGSVAWVTGLDAGEQVVVEGMHLLSHGETVRVVEEGAQP
ncbi:MAG: HlyD family efflux transporter periplasmic adaptor subunit [Bacillota bacterium]|nr:HlyD family efflux transporter periplasmic adaptor subunit [Bacillota bacterium]MDW7676333.1 HlyD family efflux transporter periplasmic adaptor subunit [Bacillota bacterium]